MISKSFSSFPLKFTLSIADNISMNNFKVTLGYSSETGSYSSKSRYVLADTKINAVKQAISLMTFSGKIDVLRVDVH